MEDGRRYRYWPLVTVALLMAGYGVAGLLWDEGLSAPGAKTGIAMGVVYGLSVLGGLLLLAVAGQARRKRR